VTAATVFGLTVYGRFTPWVRTSRGVWIRLAVGPVFVLGMLGVILVRHAIPKRPQIGPAMQSDWLCCLVQEFFEFLAHTASPCVKRLATR
jgi:hypothetical protein